MKKSMLFAAAAVVAMVGCTNEDFTGFQNKAENGEAAISFGSGTKKLTRAENDITGADAAKLLSNNFVVKGIKGNGEYASTTTTLTQIPVFDSYNVNYVENTAGSTESNSKNWEYVGQDVSSLAASIKTQTIKYWDFAENQYDFIAFSKGDKTKNTDDIKTYFPTSADFSKLGSSNAAYTVEGTLDQLKECYVADLVTVYNEDFGKKPVTPQFRRMQSKIRLGFYETVPGYSVRDVVFYSDATSTTAAAAPTVFTQSGAKSLGVGSTVKGKMEVSFPTVGKDKKDAIATKDDYNKAHIKFTLTEGELASSVAFKALTPELKTAELYETTTGNQFLGRSSNDATYAGTNNGEGTNDFAYVGVLPTGTGSVLNIRVDYTLEAIDGSGEVINVKGATAQVPSVYTNWQPNYAYTYLFKISDQTNGKTNPDKEAVGLYPITFDAVVMADIDGIQETITEVGVPSITTYQKGKVVTENDEYDGQDTIFTVVKKDGAVQTLYTASDKGNTVGFTQVFTATVENNALQAITEKSADNCFFNGIVNATAKTITVKDAAAKTLVLTHAEQGADQVYNDKSVIYATSAPGGVTTTVSNVWIKPTSGNVYVLQTLTKAGTYETATETKYHEGVTYYDGTTYARLEAKAASTDLSKYYVEDQPKGDDTYTEVPSGTKFYSAAKIKYYKKTGTNAYEEVTGFVDGQDLSQYEEGGTAVTLYTMTPGTPATYKSAVGFYDADDAVVYYTDDKGTEADKTKFTIGADLASDAKTCTADAEYAYKVIRVK